MDLIHNDIRKTCIDTYIGKVANNYDNKCVLITAISSYFEELAKEQLIEKDFKVEIDIDKQVKYLKSIGCYLVQGFLYERPIPKDEFKNKYLIK